MMPNENEVRRARTIVKAYRASGIAARTYCGRPFIEREEGWEGPLDINELQKNYRDEIDRIEQNVREAVKACFDRLEEPFRTTLDRETWVAYLMGPIHFMRLGLDEHRARMYVNVAQSLQYRRDLWR